MPKLRRQLLDKMKSADSHLETVKGYLKDVGARYFERFPERTEQYKMVYVAVEEIQEAVRKLIEEI